MALPTDIQTGTVTGKYTNSDGTPAQGTVTFTPAAKYVVSPVTKTTVIMAPLTVTLDASGQFSAVLIASNDADMVPAGWTWDATVTLTSAVRVTTQAFTLDPGATLDITGITTVQTNLGTAPALGVGGSGPAAWGTLTGKPAVIAAGADQATARAVIAAGTSNLVLGTTPGTARAGDAPTAYADLTGKPATFAPSAHTHVLTEIAGTTATGQAILSSATGDAALTAQGMTPFGRSLAKSADASTAQGILGTAALIAAALSDAPRISYDSGYIPADARPVLWFTAAQPTNLRSQDRWFADAAG